MDRKQNICHIIPEFTYLKMMPVKHLHNFNENVLMFGIIY